MWHKYYNTFIKRNGGIFMSYPELKYRSRLTTSVDNGILDGLEKLVEKLDKPKSWIMDEALEDLLKKYEIPYEKTSRTHRSK